MKRSPPLALLFTLASCTAADSGAANDAGASDALGADSSMVVTSEPRVPSGSEPTVVFLGTSLTAGLGLDDPALSYVGWLETIAESSGTPFRAVNAGVSGETSAGGLRRLDWILREPLDVLVIELGANDGLRGQDVEAMAQNLSRIAQHTRTRYPEAAILLVGMEAPPNMGERYTGAFRQAFARVAERNDVTLIPFPLEGVAGVPELNQEDRIHPTPEGHRRIAENMWPHLRPVLEAGSNGG